MMNNIYVVVWYDTWDESCELLRAFTSLKSAQVYADEFRAELIAADYDEALHRVEIESIPLDEGE